MKWFISKNGIEAVENGQDFIVIYSERDMNSVINKFDNISKYHFKEIQLVNDDNVVQSVTINDNYLTNKTNIILMVESFQNIHNKLSF